MLGRIGLHTPVLLGLMTQLGELHRAYRGFGGVDAFQCGREILVVANLDSVVGGSLHGLPLKVEWRVDAGIGLRCREHRCVELVVIEGEQHGVVFIAHAVEHAHGILVVVAILFGDGKCGGVAHAQQVFHLTCERGLVHCGREGIDGVAHALMSGPGEVVTAPLQILHRAGVESLFPGHHGWQSRTGVGCVEQFAGQRGLAAHAVQIFARIIDGAGCVLLVAVTGEFHLVDVLVEQAGSGVRGDIADGVRDEDVASEFLGHTAPPGRDFAKVGRGADVPIDLRRHVVDALVGIPSKRVAEDAVILPVAAGGARFYVVFRGHRAARCRHTCW